MRARNLPRGLAVLAVAASILFGPTSSHAAPSTCTAKGSTAGAARGAEAIAAETTRMFASGQSKAAVEKNMIEDLCLKKISEQKVAPDKLAVGSEGVTTLGTGDGVGNGDVVWNTSLWYEPGVNQYYALGTWNWINHDYGSDVGIGCWDATVGGLDGVGMRLSGGEYNIRSAQAYAWGDPSLNDYSGNYGVVELSTTWDDSQYGVSFQMQDHAIQFDNWGYCSDDRWADFNMYGGEVLLALYSLDGACHNAQVFVNNVHTWSSTSINSFSVGPYSFGVSWTSGSSGWQWGAGSGASGQVCGGTSHLYDTGIPPRGPGGGSGTTPPSPMPRSGRDVKRNDYNRDGISDIVAVYNDYIYIWFGTGSGGFTTGGPIGSGWTPYASTLTAVGDINGDGNGDLVAVYNDYLYTWFGTGSGGFATGGPIGSGWTPYASTLTGMGDINSDGRSDLLAISNDYIYKWFGTSSGGYATGGPIGSGWNIYAPIH